MRRTIPLCVFIFCFLSQVKSQCNPSDAKRTDKTFPDIFKQSVSGYQLSAEFANTRTNETVFVNEYVSIVGKAGKLEIFKNGDYKRYFYFHNTNEGFTISGFKCEADILDESAPPFLEDLPHRWLDYEEDYKLLGPSATIRQAFLAWKEDNSKVIYVGDIDVDRGIRMDKWRQCIDKMIIEYSFSKPTWHNAYDISDVNIPVKVEIITGGVTETVEFFSYQPYSSQSDVTFDIPDGYGCNRTALNEVDVPEIGGRDHYLEGEMVYHAIDMENKKYSRFISAFQIVYHYSSDMLSYMNSPWKTGNKGSDGAVESGPLKQVIWDNRNNIQYEMNLDERKCSLAMDPDFYPKFDLPGEGGNVNLLDPRILISTDGFKYLGQQEERGIPVHIFESEVPPTFLLNSRAAVGVITRAYATEAAVINTGNHEMESPVRITLTWFEDDEKTKIQGILVTNIFSYANTVPFIQDEFDVEMCFPDYDASTWFKITFPNMGVSRSSLVALSKEIEEEFLGVLYTHTETTPIRVPRVLVDVTDDDFSVEAMVLERPPIAMDFKQRGKLELETPDSSIGMVSQDECLQGCVDYTDNKGAACRTVSYCGASCYISTGIKAAAKSNGDCALYDRVQIAKSLPSMDKLVKDIRKLVIADQFSLTFQANVGDMEQAITFQASSFGDSVGDTRGRLVSRLFQSKEFKLSYVGMKLVPAKNDRSKNVGKVSISACMRVCLNNPYCETLSYCQGSSCVVSTEHANDISIERMTKDNKCVIFGRNYLQQYKKLAGISLTRYADNVVDAENADVCAKECTKENKFECKSFDFCEDRKQCLLHSMHYLELKTQGSGIEISANCSHYSRLYVYDYKMVPNRRVVGDTQVTLQHNSVEDCAKECRENGGFTCTAFDFCEGVESLDNKCTLITTPSDDIKLEERTDCRHYVDKGLKSTGTEESKEKDKPKRYSNGLAGGLGFLFFLIGSVLGVGGTYLFGYMRANRG